MGDNQSAEEIPPKVFISYRWSSPDHEDWVLRFATSLRDHGIDAYLDKWHLKEGQDTLTFMESMVTDSSVQKVLMICDSGYVSRADSREGGVGTEAQIISAKVYQDTGQDKFAAVVVELNESGQPMLPLYMSTRLYFDMSSAEAEATNFEKIVRWVFDKPFHVLPPIGVKPDFDSRTYTTASPLFRIDSPRLQETPASRLTFDVQHILDSVAAEAESFMLTLEKEPDGSEIVVNGIRSIKPVSENLYRALKHLISNQNQNSVDIVHRFFEKLMKLWDYRLPDTTITNWDNDVIRFFCHDALVSFVAIAMDNGAFQFASDILSMPLYKPHENDRTGQAVNYVDFRPYLQSLEHRNKALSLRRISLHADLLKESHSHSVVSFSSFLEADLTLHIRGLLSPKLEWYPISSVYLTDTYGSLPTYIRASSRRIYERLRPLLLNHSADDLRKILAANSTQPDRLRFDFRSVEIQRLVNAEALATNH